MHLVLDFSVGQGSAVVEAPVHGLEPLVDETALEKLVKGRKRRRLIGRVHRQVGLIPLAEDAQPFKLASLEVHKLLRVSAAGGQEVLGRHFELFAPQLLVHLDLDRQPVAVPAGDVGGVEAGHGFGLDDKVFQALVERVAQVDGPVRVGRSIVQKVLGRALPCRPDLAVQVHLRPLPEAQRLILRQVRLHGKGGFRQQQGLLQLGRPRPCGVRLFDHVLQTSFFCTASLFSGRMDPSGETRLYRRVTSPARPPSTRRETPGSARGDNKRTRSSSRKVFGTRYLEIETLKLARRISQ